ncbi:MAG TPA: hypothetical protein VLA88_02045 [Candidatus Saccharimonadales bacterium]|nr:hypothetical protein [Candidatus Saccharimonadales bacterium]
MFAGALLAYLLGGLLLIWLYRHQINPDGVAYISIAQKYAHGQFGDALNGYWGPLLSWLLVPFAWLGLPMQLGAKLIALCAGGATIVLAWRCMERWQIGIWLRYATIAVLIVLAWYWALPSPITPDLIMVPILLGYTYVLAGRYASPMKQGFALGAIAALGYYGKSYFLPFFMAHIVVWSVFIWWRNKKHWQQALQPYAVAVVVAVLLIAPWAIAISAKYHQLTLSTSGQYNFNLIGPASAGHPVTSAGLLPPPNSTAITAWEDPTYTPISGWSPLSSRAALVFYGQTIIENVRAIGALFVGFSVFALAVLAAGIILLTLRWHERESAQLFTLLSTIVVYAGGYALVVREERYLWPAFGLTLLLAVYMANYYGFYKKRAAFMVGAGMMMASVVAAPITILATQANTGLALKQGADVMRPLFTGKERVASDSFDSFAYCYYLRVVCYGQINPLQGDQAVRDQLKHYQITDIILMKPAPELPVYLSNYEVVPTNNPAIILLRLKK